jgi:hypothetical protein
MENKLLMLILIFSGVWLIADEIKGKKTVSAFAKNLLGRA